MDIKLINLNNFGAYHAPVKTLFLSGKFGDKVTKGFYGDTITPKNVSLEHLEAHSRGGRNNWGNLVLASKTRNGGKGASSLHEFINIEAAKAYLQQFTGIHIPGKFDGDAYIRMVKKKLADMHISLDGGEVQKRMKPHIRTKKTRSFFKR